MPEKFWVKLKNQTNFIIILHRQNCITKFFSYIWYFLVIFGNKSELYLFLKLDSLQNYSLFDALCGYFFQMETTRLKCHPESDKLHRSTKLTKFFVQKQNHLFPYNFGSLSPNPKSVFFHHVRISQYCQFHGCQV